ncbi:MAG: flagellar motor switch protein FliN [Fimbriimonadaceae bacterium]|nr:flagellar motor switch protein FliN [Fimbriimonadaceae bacterium]
MSNIPQSTLEKLNEQQAALWQAVTNVVSEAAGKPIKFENPLTLETSVNDLYDEMSSPKLAIQFSFSESPMNQQVILINPDSILHIAEEVLNKKVESVDDAIVTDLRPVCEAIVQGICQAAGSVTGEPVMASGLTARYQIFNFPSNFHADTGMVRVNVAISSSEWRGSVIWLFDEETATTLAPPDESEEFNPFGGSGAPSAATQGSAHEQSPLELLFDVPLQVSVELGRLKMAVRDIVELAVGSIVELDKTAGEPVDVLVNGKLVARGEVVVIEDNFGVRITEIITQQERLQRLNDAA